MSTSDGPQPDRNETSDCSPAAADTVRACIEEFFTSPGGDARTRQSHRQALEPHLQLIRDLEERLGEATEAAGIELGSFRLEMPLGRGAMGCVYRAIHHRTGAAVALKTVPEAEKGMVAALFAEAEGLASLNHPNIIKIIDRGTDKGFAWIATELVEGRNLKHEIDRRTGSVPEGDFLISFDPDVESRGSDGGKPATGGRRRQRRRIHTYMEWFRSLASALFAMHEVGLIHRDVKPANIMISDSNVPYLIDFGLSTSPDSPDAIHGILAGTVPYMSPEQTLSGYVALTHRSDLYSLAISFHELLCGRRVAEGAGRGAILQEIAFNPVPAPSRVARRVPRGLDPVFAKALAKHPDQRYASGRELAQDLDDWLHERPLTHAVESRGIKLRRFARLHPAVFWMTALILLGAAVYAGALAVAGRLERERTLVSMRADVDQGAYDKALVRARREAPDHIDNVEFKGLYRTAVEGSVRRRIEEMIRFQSVSVAALAAESRFMEYASSAREDLEYFPLDPRLLFIVGFGQFMAGKADEIIPFLDSRPHSAERTGTDALLMELRAVAMLEAIRRGEGEISAYLAFAEELEPDASHSLADALTCMRGYRVSLHDMLARKLENPGLVRPVDDLRDVEKALRLLRSSNAKHRLARTLLARMDLERGRDADFRAAQQEFQRIVASSNKEAEKVGPQFFCALSAALITPEDEAERARLENLAHLHAEPVLDAVPHLARRFASEAWHLVKHTRDPRILNRVARMLLAFPAVRTAPPREVLALAQSAAGWALKTHAWQIAIDLGAALGSAWNPDLDDRSERLHRSLLVFQLWGLQYQLDELGEGREAWDERAKLGLQIQNVATSEEKRRGPLPYDALAAPALTAAALSKAAPDQQQRDWWRQQALLWLERVTDQSALEAELERTTDPQARETLEYLHGEALEALREIKRIP